MSYGIGDKVVCIDVSGLSPGHTLTLNAVYTVRDIDRRAYEIGAHDAPTVRVEEHRAPDCITLRTLLGWNFECGFHPNRFAPIRKTDISIFTAMLKEKETETV